jgi:molybdate transport system ATP-binding protein
MSAATFTTIPTPSHDGLHVRLASKLPISLQAQFDCAPGELIALVGASGSGKTTLLRTLAGLHASADLQGTIRVGSSTWLDSARGVCLTPQARHVGLVFQHYALFPHLNAINNIAITADNIRTKGRFDAENRALQWLERLGLAQLAQRPVQQLSGGQQQRVALARACARIESGAANGQASVLLLDEPFSAVDAPMRQVLYRELAQLRAQLHVPIVLVTHDLQEARRLASRIVIIDGGQSLQSGSPAEVLRSPRNARVAHLVGIHNHFSARFHKKDDKGSQGQAGRAHLQWGDSPDAPRLVVRDKGKIADGTAVTWVLAGEAVQLLASGGFVANQLDGVNLLDCQLTELLPLGEISLCRFSVSGTPDQIELNLSASLLAGLNLQAGDRVALTVPEDAAHIMPIKTP